ncbi:MAG: DUF2092 domain-containing protein, partial [Candidatus Omnitrophota bacterium]
VAGCAVLFLLVMVSRGWAEEPAPQQGPKTVPAALSGETSKEAAKAIDPRALDTLKLMSDTLAQAKSVQFEARSMVPIKSPSGLWVSLFGTARVVKEGTGKLFAETRGDFFPYDFYFDGKSVTAYSPTKNLYAEKAAPGTIEDVIEAAYREEGKSFPYADILVAEPYKVLADGLVKAAYVGQSTIGGVKTDHLVFANKGVEWQIWIGAEDHLPRLVYGNYFDDISEPSYTVGFLNWKVNQSVPPETFVFQNASKAVKVEFRNPMQQGRGVPSGAAAQQ